MGFPRQEYWSGLPWRSISFSKGASQPRDWTWVSCIGGWTLYHRSHREARVELCRLIRKLCFPLERWKRCCLWSRSITPPAWVLIGAHSGCCAVSVKCSVKATGIGPRTLLLVFLKDVPSWWISILTHNSIPHWTELSHILHHESTPPGSIVLASSIPASRGDGQRKGGIFSSPSVCQLLNNSNST